MQARQITILSTRTPELKPTEGLGSSDLSPARTITDGSQTPPEPAKMDLNVHEQPAVLFIITASCDRASQPSAKSSCTTWGVAYFGFGFRVHFLALEKVRDFGV